MEVELDAYLEFGVVDQESSSSEGAQLCVVDETQELVRIALEDSCKVPVAAGAVLLQRPLLLPWWLDYDLAEPFVDYGENIVALVSADEARFEGTVIIKIFCNQFVAGLGVNINKAQWAKYFSILDQPKIRIPA